MKTLLQAQLNQLVVIGHIEHETAMKRRLMDLGFMENTTVLPILDSPSVGMRAYIVKGCKIALRNVDSACIILKE